MRLRNRHFNARHAGADLVLDSRFIDQADNTEVSSWTDRSANAHTIQQTTQANRPTFQTAELNGNPVVRFDGSNDFLTGGDILDIGTNSLMMISTAKRSSGSGTIAAKSIAAGFAGRYGFYGESNTTYVLYQGGSTVFQGVSDTSTSPTIFGIEVQRSTAARLRFNGTQQASGSITGNDASSFDGAFDFRVGAYTSTLSFWNGDIAQLVLVFRFDASLRKRLEHAAAYSFKIACN